MEEDSPRPSTEDTQACFEVLRRLAQVLLANSGEGVTLVEKREEPRAEAAFELEVAFPLRGQRARKRRPRDIALAHHDLAEWEVVRLLIPESRIELVVRQEPLIYEQFAETPHVIPQSPQL